MNGAGDVDLAVFVPGLMGAGILLSAGILLADGLKRLIPNRGVRRRVGIARAVHGAVEGAAMAAGYAVPEHDLLPRRLRARWAYLALAFTMVTAGVVVTRLFLDAYADPLGTLHHNPWAIGLAVLADVPLLLGVLVSTLLALLPRRLTLRLPRLVANTWLGRPTPPPENPRERALTLIPWLREGDPR